MDARKAGQLRTRLASVPRITRRDRWESAPQSRALNLSLAAGWLGLLYALGFFTASSDGASAEPLTFADTLALVFFLANLSGIFAVVGLALSNHRATAAVSAVSGIGIIVLGATCGFAGHPVSAWGLQVGLAGVLVAASIAVMGRRAPTT